MMQERLGRRLDDDMLAIAPDIEPVERLYGAGGLTMGRAKSSEIVQADQ